MSAVGMLGLVAAADPITPHLREPMLDGAAATVALVVAAVLVLAGACWVLVSAVAMHRVSDALSRVNALGPATGVGLPWIVIGAWLHTLTVHPFAWVDVAKVAVTIVALLIVSSVASNVLARASVLSGAETDPETSPNDLLEP